MKDEKDLEAWDAADPLAECDYDPLEDGEEDWDDDDRAELYGYVGDPGLLAARTEIPEKPQRTPRERIADLFGSMAPYRRTLLAIMAFCEKPRSVDDLESHVAELLRHRGSVFTAASFCKMLFDAGMIERVDADGNPYSEGEAKPVEVEGEDGEVYLRPAAPPPVFWVLTEEGRGVVEEDDATAQLWEIIEEQARYASVFRGILLACDEGDGATITDIVAKTRNDPVLADPPKMPQFFMDYLERNGAIEWRGAWTTTEVGKEILAMLAAADGKEAAAR